MKHANRSDFGQLQDTDVDLKERVRALACELDEALQQQIAPWEVLRAISSSSPGELELIFQTTLANAIRICNANFGALFRFEDGVVRAAAMIGVSAIYRQEVCPFSEKQVTLVTNFAAQAVVAIENARLFKELRESLQQQTATADMLKVISRSSF